jgi:hypothetical protein
LDGGIFGLLGLIALHRGAVEYDLRHRFQIGLRDVGRSVTLAEVGRLVVILRRDPSSAITAALEGWDYPIDRTTLAILDLFDVTVLANSDMKKGRPTPHGGRPYSMDRREVTQHGNAAGRSPDEVKAILSRMREGLPV